MLNMVTYIGQYHHDDGSECYRPIEKEPTWAGIGA
jgi:hypothetical protein